MSFFRDRRDGLIVLSFLFLTLLFFARFLTGETVFAFKDLSRYFYPLRHLMVEQVMSGHLPLWNPYSYCGWPLLATLQICFFYPMTLIYYLLPFGLAFNYYIISHYFLAGWFMYLLLRHFQLPRGGAYFGGVVYMFSGYLLSVSNMNTSLSAAIWLPLALLLWDRVIKPSPPTPLPVGEGRRGTRRGEGEYLAFVLVSSLMLLGGEPTIIYFSYWLFLIYGLVFGGRKWRSILLLAGAGLLTAGLCAVQLFPFLELTKFSDRVATGYELISSSSFPPRETISLILPYFFGNPGQFCGYADTLLGPVNQSWLISPYFGILPLFFLLFALKGKRPLFFWVVAIFSLFMAFGQYSFIFPLAYKLVPGVALIRYPVKYLFMANFAFVVLAALGFTRFTVQLQDEVWLKRFQQRLQALVGGLLIVAGLAYLNLQNIFDLLASRYPRNIPEYFFDLLAQIIEFDVQTLFIITIYFGVLLLIVWLFARRSISRSWLIAAVTAIVIADLMVNGVSTALGVPQRAYTDEPQSYRLVKQGGAQWRVFFTPELERENKTIAGDDYVKALLNAKENFAPNWHLLYRVENFSGYESIKPNELIDYWGDFSGANLKQRLDLLSQASVRYLASSQALNLKGLKLINHRYIFGAHLYLYENPGALPKARFADGRGQAKIVKYESDRVEITVESRRGGQVVLADRYYPGWECLVDGQKVPIIKAGLFRGCLVPAGQHQIVYLYRPGSLFLGGIVSLGTLALFFGGLAVVIRRRK
ncbi:MAG: hypothetical protein WC772_03000 [Candidatus Margulisiibacteriota bacterium]|jgi:hypothetical protein